MYTGDLFYVLPFNYSVYFYLILLLFFKMRLSFGCCGSIKEYWFWFWTSTTKRWKKCSCFNYKCIKEEKMYRHLLYEHCKYAYTEQVGDLFIICRSESWHNERINSIQQHLGEPSTCNYSFHEHEHMTCVKQRVNYFKLAFSQQIFWLAQEKTQVFLIITMPRA